MTEQEGTLLDKFRVYSSAHFPKTYVTLYKEKKNNRLIITLSHSQYHDFELPEEAYQIGETINTGEPNYNSSHSKKGEVLN